MKIAVRRRLALGGVVTAGAVVAGLMVVPALAADGGLSVNPSAVFNASAQDLTFRSTDADLRYGGSATFVRLDQPATFTATIEGPPVPTGAAREGTATVDFTDLGDGLAADGPAESGNYRVTAVGADAPLPVLPGGGGTDNCAGCFTVLAQTPLTATSVAPAAFRPTQAGNISVLGTGFTRGTTVTFLKAGAVDTAINANLLPRNANDANVVDNITTNTQLSRRVEVAVGATAGPRDVRVTTVGGLTALCAGCFTVSGAPLTSVVPAGGNNDPGLPGRTFSVTVSGSDVTDGQLTMQFLGTPGSSTRQALTLPTTRTGRSGATLTATIDIGDAAPGEYLPVVTNPMTGVVNACDTCRFTVLQNRMPAITTVDRTGTPTGRTQAQGTTEVFDIAGSGFSRGAAVVVSGTGVTTTQVEFVSTNLLRATFQTTSTATVGDRNVTVTLTDGKTTTANNAYAVTAGTASPSPSSTASPTASPTATPTGTPSPSASATSTATVEGRYVGLASPDRVLDTRESGPRRSGLISLDLSSRLTDPGVTTAVLNVTVTNPDARGFLVAYPSGTTRPGTSNVNFEEEVVAAPGRPSRAGTQANEVVVRVPANKRVSLFVDSAAAHVIVDLVGSFTTTQSTGGRVTTQAPARALDTRSAGQRQRSGEVVVDLSGRLPATATAAILNVTITEPTARGFVVAYPTGTTKPRTSNVNFERGQTQANQVTTQVGTGANAGKVSLFVDSASAVVIADLVGAVTAQPVSGTQAFVPLASPARATDTRQTGGPRTGAFTVQMPSSVPSNATGVVLNVTATNGDKAGFVTVYPAGQANPGTSNVNFPRELTQANEVLTGLGTNRSVSVFVGGGTGGSGTTPRANVIVDVVGYLVPQSAPAPSASASPSPSAGGGGGILPSILPLP